MTITRAQYIRFKKADGVMGPGRAQSTITKAYTHTSPTAPAHEVMDEIIVGDFWVVLRATRKTPDGKAYVAERVVRADLVIDFEPIPDDDAPKKGKAA